jgi:DNA invertase Pin-like site-specific DNA recombinase
MNPDTHQKITPSHLKRAAYLYVRQSTLRQVFENTESTKRQYALRQRAIALGWAADQIVVIDCDLGQSGASSIDRAGFQQLVAEVGMGRAGIVLGLEVSRLARSSTDWHRLLEICALTDTLILDEDGVYDPGHFNDRLLLGLKGTMSEAELHVLRARLLGGVLSKARRGELRCPIPVGLVYAPDGQVVRDPDQQVQGALRLFFETFRRTGSAFKTVQALRVEGIAFPQRLRKGPRKGEVVWGQLEHAQALHLLHNPRFAGAFAYGRSHTRKTADGKEHTERRHDPQEWLVCLRDAHDSYISWEDYEENVRGLRANARARAEQRKAPPREGPALLQGLVLCGRCGERMTVRYHSQRERLVPDYMCQKRSIERGETNHCQVISGGHLDQAVGDLLVEAMTPLALEVALTVQAELAARAEAADLLRAQQVERARHEAELAQHRFLRVHPDNRLVADALEADWNAKLRMLTEAQEAYEQGRKADQRVLDEQQRAEILALATDFPRLWRDPNTPDLERKRMVRLLVEDVTLLKGEVITAHIRFKGGATQTLTLPRPLPAYMLRQTPSEAVRAIDDLLDRHTDAEIAAILNDRGLRSYADKPFDRLRVREIRLSRGFQDRFSHLRARGLLTLDEMAERLGVCAPTVKIWRRHGLLASHVYNDKGQRLYEPPTDDAPAKWKWKMTPRRTLHPSPARGAV